MSETRHYCACASDVNCMGMHGHWSASCLSKIFFYFLSCFCSEKFIPTGIPAISSCVYSLFSLLCYVRKQTTAFTILYIRFFTQPKLWHFKGAGRIKRHFYLEERFGPSVMSFVFPFFTSFKRRVTNFSPSFFSKT